MRRSIVSINVISFSARCLVMKGLTFLQSVGNDTVPVFIQSGNVWIINPPRTELCACNNWCWSLKEEWVSEREIIKITCGHCKDVFIFTKSSYIEAYFMKYCTKLILAMFVPLYIWMHFSWWSKHLWQVFEGKEINQSSAHAWKGLTASHLLF